MEEKIQGCVGIGGGEEMSSAEDRRRELGGSEHGKCWGKGAVCQRPGSVWASEALFIHMCSCKAFSI